MWFANNSGLRLIWGRLDPHRRVLADAAAHQVARVGSQKSPKEGWGCKRSMQVQRLCLSVARNLAILLCPRGGHSSGPICCHRVVQADELEVGASSTPLQHEVARSVGGCWLPEQLTEKRTQHALRVARSD